MSARFIDYSFLLHPRLADIPQAPTLATLLVPLPPPPLCTLSTSARGMAQPSLGLAIESGVRLSPEERAASWTDFRGLVTAPTSNRGR